MATEPIKLKRIPIKRIVVPIRGMSPLVPHRKSEGLANEMRRRKMQQGKPERVVWDPEKEAEAGTYKMPDGSPAFAATAFKNAIVSAADKTLGLPKTKTCQSLFIVEEAQYAGKPVIPIDVGMAEIKEELVGIGINQQDLRARYHYHDWSAKLVIDYDSSVLSEEVVVNLVERAGFKIGVGDGRPEKKGGLERGRWEIVKVSGSKSK